MKKNTKATICRRVPFFREISRRGARQRKTRDYIFFQSWQFTRELSWRVLLKRRIHISPFLTVNRECSVIVVKRICASLAPAFSSDQPFWARFLLHLRTIIAGIHADISSSLRPSLRSLFLFPSRPLFESKAPWNLALATVGGQLQYRLVFPTVISLPSSYIPRRVYRLPRYRANFRPRTYLCFSAIWASRRETMFAVDIFVN